MKQFLLENWRLLLEAICLIVSLVFCLVRKKPVKVVDTLKEIIVRLLPGLINQAEIKFGSGNGSDKLTYVIILLREVLSELGYSDEVVAQYISFAESQVEVILSTPQKKVR